MCKLSTSLVYILFKLYMGNSKRFGVNNNQSSGALAPARIIVIIENTQIHPKT